ncbi:hypothetical protein FH972_022200 [Carpinus fangiana]|uniref:Major facilitator superfamily (MFS) profile domain-containing protein n=1 Tax=Carpinus fangiana TaxID=176857 RepID=A0A5N6KRX4_9ROSI|nr:hypothetical protein FH972_022200 [Carpinus fangiana]
MNPEDYEVIDAERDASPRRFSEYDPHDSFRRQYSRLHPDQREALSRTVTGIDSDAESVESRESAESVELQEIRTARLSPVQTRTQSINTLERHVTALDRIETHRSQHLGTVGSTLKSRTSGRPLPSFGAGKPYPPPLPAREEYVVEFDGQHDPLHPQNWPMKRKLFIGAILAFDSLSATFASSVFSPATQVIAGIYGVSSEVTTLATSLFVLGYAFGPLVWAPMSELYGRRLPIVIASFGFGVFAIGVAVAKDLQTIIICRFFCGLFGSCPLAVVAAVFADMFDNSYRGIAVAVFSATVFMGPLLAPFVGGFITISYLGWRWTMYIAAIMGFTAFVLTFFFLKESYPPVVLVEKASELRRRTKNWGIHAKQEEVEVDFGELITKNLSRPMRILFTEPIVLLITIYMSFIYGLLYLFLTAYALVFQRVYGMNAGVGGLPYFGMVTGELIAFTVVIFMNKGYIAKLQANNNVPVPEWRLPIVIAGGLSFAGGLFWFGWTGYTGRIPWIVPTLSGLATGFGIFAVFLQLLNYIVDAYLMFAASAIAGNTFMRSLFGCIFPLFATYMFDGMGIEWAATLLGCVALLLVPLPVIFLLYGKRIRARSKFAPAPDLIKEKKEREMRDEEAARGAEASSSDPGSGEAPEQSEKKAPTATEGQTPKGGEKTE